MNITQKKFFTDMKWLSENGCQAILPSELYYLRLGNFPLPQKTVMIVFDDGYCSNYTLAFPVLKETGMKAAVMLITSQIKDLKPLGAPRVAPLSWHEVEEMSKSGLIEFGSHTDNLHNPAQGGNYISGKPNGVQRLAGETRGKYELRLDADIKKSIMLIREYARQEVFSFAYPFGVKEEWADNVLKKNGIEITFLTGNQVADISRGLYDLKRITVTENTDISKLFGSKR